MRSAAVIDLEAVRANVATLVSGTSAAVMAVVKADGYGHGMVPCAQAALDGGATWLGVAMLEEALDLRTAGFTCPILAWLWTPDEAAELERAVGEGVDISVSAPWALELVRAAVAVTGRVGRIHLKIDTGMERIGVHSYSAAPFIEAAVASRWCRLKGIYSHLACADDPASPMTLEQLDRFLDACAHITRIGAPMPVRHLANSGGVLHFPQTHLDMVRPGILLYGVLPDPASIPAIDVRPALSLVSQVVYFKVVRAGHPVSYGATWAPAADTRVVTVPIGYGDGFPRALSSRGQVLVRGQRRQLVGRVCMDQFMVDLGPAGTAYNEDEVILVGSQQGEAIRAEDLARLAGTIPYEILTGLNQRIPREYRGG